MPSMLKQDQPVNVTGRPAGVRRHPVTRRLHRRCARCGRAKRRSRVRRSPSTARAAISSATGPVTTSDHASAGRQQGRQGEGQLDRHLEGFRVRRRRPARHVHRRCTHHRSAGRSHVAAESSCSSRSRATNSIAPRRTTASSCAATGRKTTGQRLTFFGVDQRYLVTGSPVTIVDECGRETTGRTLTFFRTTDRIVVDGNEQIRTQTTRTSRPVPNRPLDHRRGHTPHIRSHEVVRRTDGGPWHQSRGVVRRGGGPARTERRRQDDHLLHDRRPRRRPDSGRVELNGVDVTDDPMYVRARKGVGYLPQEAVDLPRAHGRAEHHGHSRDDEHGRGGRAAPARGNCSPS